MFEGEEAMDFDFNSGLDVDEWELDGGEVLGGGLMNDVKLGPLDEGAFGIPDLAGLPDLPQETCGSVWQQPTGEGPDPSVPPMAQMAVDGTFHSQQPPPLANSTPPRPEGQPDWPQNFSPNSLGSQTTSTFTTSPSSLATTSTSPTTTSPSTPGLLPPRKSSARRQPKQALSEAEKKEKRREQNRLAQERVRNRAKSTKNEANNLREENVSLRIQLNEKEMEVQQLKSMVGPLQEQVNRLTLQNNHLISCLPPHRAPGAKGTGVRLNLMSYPFLLFLGLILLTGFLLQSVHSPAVGSFTRPSIQHNTASLGLRNLSSWAPRKRPMALPSPLPRPGRRVLQPSPQQHPAIPLSHSSREGERGPHTHSYPGSSSTGPRGGGEGFIYLKIAAPQFKKLLEWVSAVVTWVGPRYESSFEFSDKDLRVSHQRNATIPMPANCAAEGSEEAGPPCGIHFDVFLPTFSTHPAFSASGELPVALPGSALGSLLGVFPVGASQ